MADGTPEYDWGPYQRADEASALKIHLEIAYLNAYAAWLSLDPVDRKIYPMPERPGDLIRKTTR